ncbi:hypothetical protein [Paenibacillus glycinis]|uniref:Uncharacterized protein n=1 Tax=Paenibacillus glycinis TaxID=2697035 RepID=A0ABW9XKZ9_9BACL|nr:hypothetical protein [Paenibacillus glycinis]NBD23267.1 hypothetical protein [Paenibacillus glycinis]
MDHVMLESNGSAIDSPMNAKTIVNRPDKRGNLKKSFPAGSAARNVREALRFVRIAR